MAELIKKQSFSIDMKKQTKDHLAKVARELRLPQGDAISFVLDQYDTNFINNQAKDNEMLMKTIISQQNQLIATLNEQNALLVRMVESVVKE